MVTAKKTSTAAAETAAKPKAKAPAKKAATAPSAPKAAVKKTAAKKSAPAKTSTPPVLTRAAVTPEQRHHYIEVAAFYVAQRRGFAPGNPVDDWAMAEREVDGLIASGHFNQ